MDNLQIDAILKNNPITREKYIGCFMEKVLPFEKRNGFMIINVESDSSKMGHWILFFACSDHVIFFDSFGFRPINYTSNINLYYNSFKTCIIATKDAIQSPTSLVCGAYCIYIAYFLCSNISIRVIIQRLKNKNSDKIVERFIMMLSGNNKACNQTMCPTHTFKTLCKIVCKC